MRNTALASLFVILAASGARAEDLHAVQALNDGLAAAFNSGDSGRLAQLYAEDAVLLPPGAELIKGKPKIEDYYRAALPTVTDSKFSAVEAKSLGDADVVEVGTFAAKTAGSELASRSRASSSFTGERWPATGRSKRTFGILDD